MSSKWTTAVPKHSSGKCCVHAVYAGSTIYVGSQPKRQKVQAPKEPQTAEAVEPDQPWELRKAQPWADKEVAPAVLNDEQKAYLEQVSSEQLAACCDG